MFPFFALSVPTRVDDVALQQPGDDLRGGGASVVHVRQVGEERAGIPESARARPGAAARGGLAWAVRPGRRSVPDAHWGRTPPLRSRWVDSLCDIHLWANDQAVGIGAAILVFQGFWFCFGWLSKFNWKVLKVLLITFLEMTSGRFLQHLRSS